MPTKIGRYHVVKRLGSGAFATVWLAEDDVLDSQVAVKVLADNWAHHPDVVARFEQEAQVLRRADSERLVRVHDYGELPDGRPYQVMTYASGGTLADRLAAGPLPVEAALSTAVEIANAVTVLHEAGVLHRDLKPSNVLFDEVRGHERVLVADLGLAKELAHASGFTMAAGTPGYMAPEQRIPGGGLDVRADVHALGAMTYQMLTGRPPHANASPSKIRSGLTKRIDRAVVRALDPDRSRRWPSAAAFASELDAAAQARRRSARHGLRLAGRLLGGSIAAAAAVTLGGAVAPAATPPDWVRVADDSHALSVAVPAAWAGQFTGGGWAPAAGHRPGLLVGADLSGWASARSGSPGVFAGVGAPSPPPRHDGCTREPARRITVAGLTGSLTRWTGCNGTAISYSEVSLGGVYVQIKQAGGPDRTEEVLSTLRLHS